MVPGFSTNSLGEIDAIDALPILHDLGYRSIAITPDRHLLDPFGAAFDAEVERWQVALAAEGMGCVIETGARHLLDMRHKHEPTLISTDPGGRGRRVGFLKAAIDLAERLDAGCVSIWSGAGRDSAGEEALWDRLVEGLLPVLDHAADARTGRGVAVAFEPEPGMFIDTLHRCSRLFDRLGNPGHLAVTIDIGHLECMGERPTEAVLAPWAGRIANVHVDDQLAARHEHLPLGAGDIDFSATVGVLRAAGYAGGLHVELPRQSHRWSETARDSAAFLGRLLQPSRIHVQASSSRDTSK
jgi:L-ribulose-5-phosphate 3-epimerase